jgi:hypothetical protein
MIHKLHQVVAALFWAAVGIGVLAACGEDKRREPQIPSYITQPKEVAP